MNITRETLVNIAGEMDLGMGCYMHLQTGELLYLPDELDFRISFLEDEENPWQADYDKLKIDESNYFQIERLPSKKGFAIMETFAFSIDDPKIKSQLVQALEGQKPFAHFKNIIHGLPENYRNDWFAIKLEETIKWIREQIDFKMR